MTPEERAEARILLPPNMSKWPFFKAQDYRTEVENKRSGFAACIREEVEPLEAKVAKQSKVLEEAYDTMQAYREEIDEKCDEVAKLRALVQVLVDALDGYWNKGDHLIIKEGLAAAKEAGFTPTPTNTEDNG